MRLSANNTVPPCGPAVLSSLLAALVVLAVPPGAGAACNALASALAWRYLTRRPDGRITKYLHCMATGDGNRVSRAAGAGPG